MRLHPAFFSLLLALIPNAQQCQLDPPRAQDSHTSFLQSLFTVYLVLTLGFIGKTLCPFFFPICIHSNFSILAPIYSPGENIVISEHRLKGRSDCLGLYHCPHFKFEQVTELVSALVSLNLKGT